LVSEGFSSLEEVAYVETDELLVIEGFDQDTVDELQARARESLDEINSKSIAEARELGVTQDLIDFEGLSPQMLVALGKDDVKSLEDFATCADWELAGGYTTVDGERHKDEGVLESFEVNIQEAQDMIMRARLQIGWVTEEQLAEDAAAAEAANAETDLEGAET
jgi:N utilization substance protein A